MDTVIPLTNVTDNGVNITERRIKAPEMWDIKNRLNSVVKYYAEREEYLEEEGLIEGSLEMLPQFNLFGVGDEACLEVEVYAALSPYHDPELIEVIEEVRREQPTPGDGTLLLGLLLGAGVAIFVILMARFLHEIIHRVVTRSDHVEVNIPKEDVFQHSKWTTIEREDGERERQTTTEDGRETATTSRSTTQTHVIQKRALALGRTNTKNKLT